MAKLTQGTKIFFVDNTVTPSVIRPVNCATQINPGGNPADQIEGTCLEDFDRTYGPGLRTPGQATIGLRSDPEDEGHLILFLMSQSNPPPSTQFMLGWSDGRDVPTIGEDGEVVLPTTRTWFTFDGYVSDFPFDFQQNAYVDTQLSIQRSGGAALVPKETA